MQQVAVKLDDLEKLSPLIKVLDRVEDLSRWLTHTKKMIAKVPGLENEPDYLETIIE